MTPTNLRGIASSLILLTILLGITLTSATAEDNYKNDNNILTNISESTLTENGYKTNIIINPNTVGIYASENGYKLDLAINTQGIGGSLEENNYILDLIPEKSFPEIADIAITNAIVSKKVVGQGYITLINVTIINQAFNYETFTIIIKANTTTIKTQTTTLTSKEQTTITYTWNTTSMAKGNYTINAYAQPVPSEANTANNNYTNGWIFITKVGDLGGPVSYVPTFFACDKKVDGYDLALFIACYKGPPNCPPDARYLGDLGGPVNYIPTFFACDGKVDGYDLALWIQCYKGLGPPDP